MLMSLHGLLQSSRGSQLMFLSINSMLSQVLDPWTKKRHFERKKYKVIAEHVQELPKVGQNLRGPILDLALKCCPRLKSGRQIENVHWFSRFEQSLPERLLSLASDRSVGGLHLGVRPSIFHGCLSGVPPNSLGLERQDKVSFVTSGITFLLCGYALRTKKCRGQLSMFDGQDIQKTAKEVWGLGTLY